MALVVPLDDVDARMAEVNAVLAEQLRTLEIGGDNYDFRDPGVEIEGHSAQDRAWDQWRLLLWMGLRDKVHAIHCHPWPTAFYTGFSYLERGTWYGLVHPPSKLIPHLLPAWRQRLASGFWGRLRRLFLPRFPIAGEVRTVLRDEAVDWVVTCWSAGKIWGVDIYRMTAVPPIQSDEERTITTGAVAD